MSSKINRINIDIYERKDFPYELKVYNEENKENPMKLYFSDIVSLLFNIKGLLEEENNIEEKKEPKKEKGISKYELINTAKNMINTVNNNNSTNATTNEEENKKEPNKEYKTLETVYFNNVSYNIQNWLLKEAANSYSSNYTVDVFQASPQEQYIFGTVNDKQYDETSNIGFVTRRKVVQLGHTANNKQNLIRELNDSYSEYLKKYTNHSFFHSNNTYDLNNIRVSIENDEYKITFRNKDDATVDVLDNIINTFKTDKTFKERYIDSVKYENSMGGVIVVEGREFAYNINFKQRSINIQKLK